MSDEPPGGDPRVEVPEAEGLIPGGGKAKLAIEGDGKVLDEVVVALEPSSGDSILISIVGEVPHDDGFISRA